MALLTAAARLVRSRGPGYRVLLTCASGDLVYHIKRDEIANVSIFSVTLDNAAVSYSLGNGQLLVDALIPADSSREVKIVYGTGP